MIPCADLGGSSATAGPKRSETQQTEPMDHCEYASALSTPGIKSYERVRLGSTRRGGFESERLLPAR